MAGSGATNDEATDRGPARGGARAAPRLSRDSLADRRPSLSPRGTTTILDDEHLMFAHINSPQTIANLGANPAIETNVVDPILRRGHRFRGRGSVHDAGEL
jgi:hypothetical protein